jgi:acetolactate synthase-1/2/3 large subunit
MKLADYVIDFLVEHGVKHVFMLPGGGAMHLNDSLGGRRSEIEFVCNLHEQASAMAAETYAKATGHLGIALVTTGPGGTNAVTGVAGAWLDSTPVLFISGQAKRPDLKADSGVRQMGVQEVDIVSIVTPITKSAVTVLDPESIRFELEKAVHLAQSGRPGPVWIDIPLDVQGATIEPAALRSFTPENEANGSDRTNLTAQVAQVIDYLNQSERPVLLAGNGIRLARAEGSFLELIERLSVPVLTTWLAVDLLPYDHKLYLGRPGTVAPRGVNFALQNSDFLLSIGSRIDFTITGYAPEKLARGAKKVMVDVDAAELRKLGGYFDLSLQVDAGDFIREFLAQSNKLKNRDRSPWMARCQEWKTKYPVVLPEHRNPDQRISTYYLAEIFSEELKQNEMIVSGSSGAGIEIFQLALKLKAGQRLFQTTALGAMGNGLPSAIGACLGSGRRETVCVDGDGGIQLNIQELATIQRLQLPIKLFILNNDGFSSIRTSQQRWFGRLMAADGTSGLTLPDITKVAAAYGLPTARIESQRNLRKEIRAVLDTPGPVVCDVWCIPDEARMPSLASSQRADGSLVSKPLEDLWPFLDRDEFRANMIIPVLEE